MTEERLVVVLTPMSVFHHTEREIVAARLETLGLTAYGQDESEAIRACKELFNKFVHSYRDRGEIEERLNQVGVEWYWADEYPDGRPSFEDTNHLLANLLTSKWAKAKWAKAKGVLQPQSECAEFAVAA